ncbi:MAG: pseudouridine synthase [Candidatus Cryptobacteroides sp.]|nr:pseudouridine synthase [Candidatus Cryptobacteroides sp.]
MEENNKSGYTAEGRKLRPRRPRISGKVYSSSEGPAERRNYGHSESRGHGSENRNYGDSRRNYGRQEGRSGYGDSEVRSYGQGRRPSYGGPERRPAYGGQERRYSETRGYGSQDRRSYGRPESRESYGPQEGRGYEQPARRPYGAGQEGGRNFGPSGRRAFNGDRRPSGNQEGGRRFSSADRKPAGRNFGAPGRKPAGAPRPSGTPRPAGKAGFAGKGAARPAAKRPNPYKFNETDEQNINIMLSRKPQLDQIQLSDNDTVETPIKEVIRLNKFIANSGICSRREADQYIQAGVVTVNGEVVTELGSKVNVFTDDIRFNGERIRGEEKVYIVMNKPKGFVTTASDPHAEKTVMDLLKKCSARVFPVGRLDKNTTGVLMFTNDGEIAERLTHPSYDKKKIYQVILDKPLSQEDFNKICEGITLNDGDIKADELEFIDPEDHRKLGIEIHSGKNRIVRRIFESLGYDVKALDRVYFAGLTKKGLKKGEWRYLSEGEVNILKMGAYV